MPSGTGIQNKLKNKTSKGSNFLLTKNKKKSDLVAKKISVGKRRGRPPGAKTRVKKPRGPEFVIEDNFDLAVSKCDYCLNVKNRNDEEEGLIYCKDCSAKAHPTCMRYSDSLARRARNSPWQCIDCKTCYVCEDSGDADLMLFCDACDKGYHMSCHNPPLTEKPQGKWACSKCVLDGSETMLTRAPGEVNDDDCFIIISSDNGLPTPRPSPTISSSDSVASLPKLKQLADSEVPDASDWTIDDVVEFFRSIGFLEQSTCFRDEEIDGKSLLLLKRSDVLSGLSLKLGPAIKIYSYIQRLQTAGKRVT